MKTIYSFSAKSLVRLIGQYTDNEFPGNLHDGGFTGSVLYSYKVNWQTVLFVGYGDDRTLVDQQGLQRADRQLFVKFSYAFRR